MKQNIEIGDEVTLEEQFRRSRELSPEWVWRVTAIDDTLAGVSSPRISLEHEDTFVEVTIAAIKT